jgi:hypothetical protein
MPLLARVNSIRRGVSDVIEEDFIAEHVIIGGDPLFKILQVFISMEPLEGDDLGTLSFQSLKPAIETAWFDLIEIFIFAFIQKKMLAGIGQSSATTSAIQNNRRRSNHLKLSDMFGRRVATLADVGSSLTGMCSMRGFVDSSRSREKTTFVVQR